MLGAGVLGVAVGTVVIASATVEVAPKSLASLNKRGGQALYSRAVIKNTEERSSGLDRAPHASTIGVDQSEN